MYTAGLRVESGHSILDILCLRYLLDPSRSNTKSEVKSISPKFWIKGWAGDINLGVVRTYMVFKAMRL